MTIISKRNYPIIMQLLQSPTCFLRVLIFIKFSNRKINMENQFTDKQIKKMMLDLVVSEGAKIKNIASKYTIKKTTLKPSIESIFTQRRILVGGAARLSTIELELIHLIDELFKKCLAYGIKHIENGKTAKEKQHNADFINGLIKEMQNDNRKLLVFATQKDSGKEIIEIINLMIKTIEVKQ